MADLTNVNLNGTSYNFRDNTAIRGVKVNGVELTADADKKVNIVNDYLMKTTNIDCRTLDQDSWYPVTFQLSSVSIELIEIILCNSLSGYRVSWSTHSYGNVVSSHKKIEMLGSDWGVNYNPDLLKGRVSVSDCNYVQVDPIQKLGQIGQCSLGYVYVRGGATYTFRLSGNIIPVLHTEDCLVGQGTSYEQTLAVLTEVPNKLINVTIANKSDIKDGVLTLQKNGVGVGTFSANQSSNKNINIEVPTKLSQLTDDVVTGKYLPAVPNSNITSVDTLDYNRRGAFLVSSGTTNTQYFEIGHGKVQMVGNCNFYMCLKVTMVTTDNYNSVYELEIHGNGSGNSVYTVLTPKMYVRKYRLYSGEPDKSLFKFYFKNTRTNDTFYARRDFDWILYFTPLTFYVSVYTEMLEFAYDDFGKTYGNKRTQDKYVLWKGSAFPNPTLQSPQTLVEGYTLASTENLIPFNRLGDTMLGDLNLGKQALVLRTDSSWSNVDRSIPFSYSNSQTRIGLYKDDFTYNPNTGVLKAGAFAKKGGTSSQFLKADGSVDSSTYLKSISVVDNNATLNYGEQDIVIGDIQGQKITVNMPDAPIRDISVVDSNPTLTWGQTKQVGTVDGKMLRVTMPANPNTDTHYTTGIVAGVSGTNANSATTNGNTYIKVTDNNTYRSQIKIQGTGATKVTSDATGVITINSTDTDTHYTTGITAGATGSTENSSVTNPFIKIKDNSVHRGQIQLKGTGDISVNSDSTGIITINGSNTKVTNANNHYTPTQNTAYNLPAVTENNCSFIKQIYRDAKGHVTGIDTHEVNFTTYGVDVTLETSTNIMSNFDANTNNYKPCNVLRFLLSMANYCVDNSYNKYCNGFISKVLLSNGDPTKTLTFSESVGSIIIDTSTPIYFEFYCDNVIDFVNYEGDGVDAHATLYATVVDSKRRAGTSSCIITLDWKSGSSMELWAVFEPYIRCNREKQSGFYYDNLDMFRDEISSVLIDEPKVDVVLNTSGAVTLLVEKMENIRGSRRLNIRLTGNKNEVELHINQYFILMNSKLNEVSIMMNFDEKGNFIDCSIS